MDNLYTRTSSINKCAIFALSKPAPSVWLFTVHRSMTPVAINSTNTAHCYQLTKWQGRLIHMSNQRMLLDAYSYVWTAGLKQLTWISNNCPSCSRYQQSLSFWPQLCHTCVTRWCSSENSIHPPLVTCASEFQCTTGHPALEKFQQCTATRPKCGQ